MTEFIIKYKTEIHTKLIEELDKEIEKSNRWQQEGLTEHNIFLKKRNIQIAGKTIDMTKKMRETIDSMSTHTINYEVVKEGEIILKFKSLVDSTPAILKKPAEKMELRRLKKEFKKDFGKDILSIEIKR